MVIYGKTILYGVGGQVTIRRYLRTLKLDP